MRIVFMGTPEFAVAGLSSIIRGGYDVVGVVTAPDKPAGRGQQVHESAVKKFALQNGLKLLQPSNLKDEAFIGELRSLNADLQIVIAFRMLPEVVWNMPVLGTYNLHASLLPKYRGAAPINWAVINGETETGVTTFKLQQEIDTGNILFNQKVKIDAAMTAGELHDKLMHVGAELILKTVFEIDTKTKQGEPLTFITQNEAEVSHAPKIFRETCHINWNNSARANYNLIRGLSPYPCAFSFIKDNAGVMRTVKLFDTILTEHENRSTELTNGCLITDNKTFLKVQCHDGYLEIKELQLEGKKRLSAEDFLRGYKIGKGTLLL